jgi:hypothetical protein
MQMEFVAHLKPTSTLWNDAQLSCAPRLPRRVGPLAANYKLGAPLSPIQERVVRIHRVPHGGQLAVSAGLPQIGIAPGDVVDVSPRFPSEASLRLGQRVWCIATARDAHGSSSRKPY